jgi:hypothetical protein
MAMRPVDPKAQPKPRLVILFTDESNRTLARQWAENGHDAARQALMMIAGRGDLQSGDTLTVRGVAEGRAGREPASRDRLISWPRPSAGLFSCPPIVDHF